jgi:hypothetical protein
MPDQIYIGNFSKGLREDRTSFNIDNDAFSLLFNMYVWRERVKRKRGTVLLGRLTRQISISAPNNNNNLLMGLEATASLEPGSINVIGSGGTLWTDPLANGILVSTPPGSFGTVNYTTGVIKGPTPPNTGTFSYYPGLPVMGLRDFTSSSGAFTSQTSNYPLLLAFDTTYAYQCDQMDVNANFFSVSYYKITGNPVIWTGQDYQLFWSTNYPSTTLGQSGAFWATNNVPGFSAYTISNVAVGNPTTITTSVNNNIQTGDQVWFNELMGANAASLNQLVFTATRTGANTFTIPVNTTGQTIANIGLVQLLTNTVGGQDGIRWYDGDPTGGTGIVTSPTTGWVNFSPPLTATTVSINGLPPALYYLVGALVILPFKDRLLFFSPWIQANGGIPIQLQDTVIWSWNGTPFYNSLVPNNQTFNVKAFYVDQTGLGGYLSAGISQPIQTVTNNEDVLLIGFGGNGRKTRFAYTGNDIQPFLYYNINSELPSSSTFSSVVLDKGAIDIGSFGICITDQQSAQRIDLPIPDEVFRINKDNQGTLRVNAIRDYVNEWIYFTYPVDNSGTPSQTWKFPTQSFFYNYRDNTWAIFYENYTAHGNYRANDVITWATLPYNSWGEWTDPWNTGTETDFEIQVIAGNPQGYILVKDVGTGEGLSGYISALSNDGNGLTQITSYNHCLTNINPFTFTTDFIYIQGAIGTNSSTLNNTVYQVIRIVDVNNFVINVPYNFADYMGAGQYSKLSHPKMQTKQFPLYWKEGKQVVLGPQRYLLSATDDGQITINIYLSQDSITPWNNPNFSGLTNGLEYSQIVFTSIEPNNLQTIIGTTQSQIWHRVNTSLTGDTFQIGLTLSDAQMLDLDTATDEIILHGMHFTTQKGPMLA